MTNDKPMTAEEAALEIVKAVDYDLWKEFKTDPELNDVQDVADEITDIIQDQRRQAAEEMRHAAATVATAFNHSEICRAIAALPLPGGGEVIA